MDTLQHVLKRYNDMKVEQDKFINERDLCDLQFESEAFEDANGKLYVNQPLEQNLIEMELGRTSGIPLYDVVPDTYRANAQQLETAKYILTYYIEKEERWKANRTFKTDKAKYGTGIYFTGLKYNQELLYTENGKEERTTREFTGMSVPIRLFMMDDRAMRQSDFNKVEDCIMIELLSPDSFNVRYNHKGYDQEAVNSVIPTMPDNGAYGIQTNQPLIVLYHYFNRITKQYAIIANRNVVIYDDYMQYPDGKLPFVIVQHYPNSSCLYGISIPRKIRSEKAYTNNMQQYILEGAKLSSTKLIATGQSGEPVDGDIYLSPGEISIAKFTNGVEQLKEINTQMNINGPLQALQTIENNIRKNTGIDLNAVFEPPANQLGTVEIIEENKQIRNKSIDELMDFGYQEMFTKILKNIVAFAPRLGRKVKNIKDKKGKVIKKITEYPVIKIPNASIKGGVIKQDLGQYGYLDFKDGLLDDGIAVRIVTGTTQNSKYKIIEKNKVNEMIGKYIELSQVFGPEAMQEAFPIDEIINLWKVTYELDDDKIVATTERDEIRAKNKEMVDALFNLQSNEIPQIPGAGIPNTGDQEEALPLGETPPPKRGAEIGQENPANIQRSLGVVPPPGA